MNLGTGGWFFIESARHLPWAATPAFPGGKEDRPAASIGMWTLNTTSLLPAATRARQQQVLEELAAPPQPELSSAGRARG